MLKHSLFKNLPGDFKYQWIFWNGPNSRTLLTLSLFPDSDREIDFSAFKITACGLGTLEQQLAALRQFVMIK